LRGAQLSMNGSEFCGPDGSAAKREFDSRERQSLLLNCSPMIDVEVTNRCNLHCLMCPRQAISRPLGLMRTETFQQIVDKCPSDTHLELCGMGEPLMHPKIFYFLDLLKEKKEISIGLTTNGTLLHPANIRRLACSRVDMITVSFNGITAEVYEGIMGGANFRAAVSQLESLLESKNDQTEIVVSVTASKVNQHEVETLRDFWMGRGVHAVRVTRCHSRAGNLRDDRVVNPVSMREEPICGIFPRIHFVAWTGEVLACCHDLRGQAVVGNVHQDDLKTLARRKLEIIQRSKLFSMCNLCDDELRYGLLGVAGTFTAQS
jgi:sulfatase maturation enzyme AslB (radical SAM superfamily)